jgi:glycosyltransferase involved in cell wall biosynthesis
MIFTLLRVRFSVITPSFRQLDWLKLCAASIADQGVELEHLVQDAGSPGIEDWAERHPGVQVFVEKDEGMYDAVNRGFRRATGDICSYLNCDEQYLPDTLRHVGEYMERHPEIDVVFGDAILTDPSLQPLSYRRVIAPTRRHTLLRPLGVLTCATFFRRKLVDDGALFDSTWKIIGDKAWILSLFDRGYRMAVLSEALAVFALTGSNLSNDQKVTAERLRWQERVPTTLRLIKPAVHGWHLFEKWRHGAYARRAVDSSWYTLESFPQRQTFAGLNLDWNWPILAKTGP